MGRGFFGGVLWGAATSGLALAALAVVVPPGKPLDEARGEAPAPRFSAVPERAGPAAPEPDSVPAPVAAPAARPEISAAPEAGPATDIELPPGSEFNRSRPATEARPPEAEEIPREAPTMGAPAPVDVTEAPLPDTAPAAAPAPVSAMPETMAPPMGSDAALDLGGAASPAAEDPPPAARAMHGPAAPEAAAAPVPEPAAPESPREAAPATSPDASPAMPAGTSPDISAATSPESSSGTETPEAAAGPAPETDRETVLDASPETAPETALDSETVPEIAADPETGPEAEPEVVPEAETAPEAGSEAPAVLPEVLPPPGPADPTMPGRAAGPLRPDAPLPMIGEQAAPVDAAPEAARPATPAMPGALALNAVPFRAPPGAPLLSLVLIDIGAEGLDRQTLLTFPFPVTFVLDPAAPDAEAAMAAYREAGYEVAVLGSGLADLAPEAAAARLGEAFDRIDGGIALVTPEERGFEGDRDLSGTVLGLLEASGHGLLTADKGLTDALRAAEQAGLREAGIFQTLDDAGQDAETIQRMLNRAVLEARQNGHAVIVGHSHPETVTAIYAWALLSGPADAVLAPLSAVLRQSRP
ncbi:hypothetical protein M2324_002120 [Rhodovulum sulfidophilum]|uniref:divergent polysaccharide deacetylase family protein n=1 Tax=Rhodovulum sulfidophilum TaxID=35806 RepID=UPI0005AAB35D|nr:divergent polysaccharide deacetylase family protein [Rhodovulum sulfidophilum]ANB34534.1 hypothetical protein A6W98_10920 [Rhodovulum sulfidophilum DSM 1374]ANB38356.1 hypothetical protein A6024_10785 [Rhodovulum sulfidophilum]MCW2303718.1 hypothetical protein [Rhodovulum sulfidophilum]